MRAGPWKGMCGVSFLVWNIRWSERRILKKTRYSKTRCDKESDRINASDELSVLGSSSLTGGFRPLSDVA
jgi:hypothetical protein